MIDPKRAQLAHEYRTALTEHAEGAAAAARMNDLIDALLELSQINRVQLGRHRVDFTALAASVLEELKRRDVSRKITGKVQPGLVVDADARLLRILLENLIGNAIKFTSK